MLGFSCFFELLLIGFVTVYNSLQCITISFFLKTLSCSGEILQSFSVYFLACLGSIPLETRPWYRIYTKMDQQIMDLTVNIIDDNLSSGEAGAVRSGSEIHIPSIFPIQWGSRGATSSFSTI